MKKQRPRAASVPKAAASVVVAGPEHGRARAALLRRLPRRLSAVAEITLPAVPALLEHYVELFDRTWTSLGRKFGTEEMNEFRLRLAARLEQACRVSPTAKVIVRYESEQPPKLGINWKITATATTLDEEYAGWVRTRPAPLFGAHADAKALDVARSLGVPAEVRVLDVGAGTGRNALALADEGFRVDALEPAKPLCELMRADAERRGLGIGIFEHELFAPAFEPEPGSYRLILLSEVVASHFRSVKELVALFERAARWLAPGGVLLFNAFLARGAYEPDDAVRQYSHALLCSLFTRRDLASASAGLPFELCAEEPATPYERRHLPPEAFPPTPWYEAWSSGDDLLDLPADEQLLELYWLTYRKR